MKDKEYKSYMHLEKLGTDEVEGILLGTCYVFPKIDGTNAQIWCEDKTIKCGSRNRELSLDLDNAGFLAHCLKNEPDLLQLCSDRAPLRFYGEWLVPHSLKTYRDDAWKQFYIFDVYDSVNERWLHFDEVSGICKGYDVNVIQPLRVINTPKLENITRCMEESKYLIKEGEGIGEGVVVKNYAFINRFGRTCWAKMTTNAFKEKHIKEMGAPKTSGTAYVEEAIVEEFLTKETTDKIIAKIRTRDDQFGSRNIGELLGTAFYDLVKENCWEFIKKHKQPTIDFKVLNQFTTKKVKSTYPELF